MTFEMICGELRKAILTSGIPRMRSRFGTSDVVQECGIQIWKQIQKQDGAHEINSSFIRKVAIGHLSKLHRYNLAAKRTIKKETAGQETGLARSTRRPEELLSMHEQACAMLESLQYLKPKHKEIIIRRFFEEETFDTIATEMNLTVYRIRTLYFSAIQTMQHHVEILG